MIKVSRAYKIIKNNIEILVVDAVLRFYSYNHGSGITEGKPIMISEIENIEIIDWYIMGNIKASNHKITQCQNQDEADNLNKIREIMDKPNFPEQVITAKILALPEHFSPEQLQMIVDGKLKDGDRVLIECKNDTYDDTPWTTKPYVAIKLNSSNHITLHKVEEKTYTQAEVDHLIDTERCKAVQQVLKNKVEEKMYTTKEVWSLFVKMITANSTDGTLGKYKEWFDENVK